MKYTRSIAHFFESTHTGRVSLSIALDANGLRDRHHLNYGEYTVLDSDVLGLEKILDNDGRTRDGNKHNH